MSILSKKIDYIIHSGLHPTLKREGFHKFSRTFRRTLTDCIQITNVQGSWTNQGDRGRFTINLAVYFPEAAKLEGIFQITDHPLESDCLVRQRIGHIMPVQKDYWWEIDSNSDLDQISAEVVSRWTDYGKPWLERYATPEAALQFVLSHKMPYWASIFSLIAGDRQMAQGYLSEALATSKVPEYTVRLKVWGRIQGLSV